MKYYVYHDEVFSPDRKLRIYEPFEFSSHAKAKEHASFFHALCGIDYNVVSSELVDYAL